MKNSLRIGIAGLGVVGGSVVSLIHAKQKLLDDRCDRPIEVVAVSARDKIRKRECDIRAMQWFDSPDELARSDGIDCFVELIGGDEGVAKTSTFTALKAGKHVVTANKALLAKHGTALAGLAEQGGILLNYEAAAIASVPVVKVMRESLIASRVERIYGIFNGTCNYILTKMESENLSFEECLGEAQRLGYAEADPAFDIEGFDSAHKLAILSSLAFGTKIAADEVYIEGISSITLEDVKSAREMGYRIKLLGVAQKTSSGIEQRVHPTMTPINSEIAQISGVTNAIVIDADEAGQLIMSGPGAGGRATASAIVGDIADIAKSRPGRQYSPVFGTLVGNLLPYGKVQMAAHEGGYFVRLTVNDRAGVFACIATRMTKQGISLKSIVQRAPVSPSGQSAKEEQSIILITHETTEKAIRRALENIKNEEFLTGQPQMIRIEK